MPAKKKTAAKGAPKKAPAAKTAATDEALFDRVATILEQARANVVRAVNSNMVLANWLIGREIVQEIQGGGNRAGYGKQVLEGLSARLTSRYGRGYSPTNLRYFRMFYQTFADRVPMIGHKVGGRLDEPRENFHGAGGESGETSIHHEPSDKLNTPSIRHEAGDVLADLSQAVEHADELRGFSPTLSWTHYRTLLSVENKHERLFYENMYVRMFDDLRRGPEDNPTVGLILCAEKDEVVAKYSVLEGSGQLFASKYMRYLSPPRKNSGAKSNGNANSSKPHARKPITHETS